MDRIFLDANVLFAAAYKNNSPLRNLWELREAELCSAGYAILEATKNIATKRPEKLPELKRLIAALHVATDAVDESSLPAGLELVAKDRPILLSAIAAKATHLLTGDKAHFVKHFGTRVAGVLILLPGEYQKLRRGCP